MSEDLSANDNKPQPKPLKPCPVCGKVSVEKYRPFCSTRCQDVDLNRWLSGSYIVPGKPEVTDDEE